VLCVQFTHTVGEVSETGFLRHICEITSNLGKLNKWPLHGYLWVSYVLGTTKGYREAWNRSVLCHQPVWYFVSW